MHRVARLVDQPEEFAVLVEAFRLESPLTSEQESEHRLNQCAERSRLFGVMWTDMAILFAITVSVSSVSAHLLAWGVSRWRLHSDTACHSVNTSSSTGAIP